MTPGSRSLCTRPEAWLQPRDETRERGRGEEQGGALSPRTLQSGNKNTSGPTGKGNPWLRGTLGEAAISAARADTFLGARYRRIIKRRGHMKALVAVARSILVSVWHPDR
ncbi:hypothetical protein QF037_009733 [Streptomyces canus]|uniref:transposase n=1 Tax=Streptomyces canus TaxID=58343 RepID=UPI0027858430|nr:hypothetical protein [Streptomyces canus]